jgi:hypothetical protein
VTAEANIDDLAHGLLRLEDERAIIRVLYKYAESIDYGDEAGWAECFTDDAVWDSAKPRFALRGAIRERSSSVQSKYHVRCARTWATCRTDRRNY